MVAYVAFSHGFSEIARRVQRVAAEAVLLLTLGELVFIVLPPDGKKSGDRGKMVDPVARTPSGQEEKISWRPRTPREAS